MSTGSNPITDRPTDSRAWHKAASASQDLATSQTTGKPAGTAAILSVATMSLIALHLILSFSMPEFGVAEALASLAIWTVMATVIWIGSVYHPFPRFGSANAVTTARAAATAILAGLIPIASEIDSDNWLWVIALGATITLCLDGVDGYLARKKHTCSAFGARFDMETDAFLALMITLFLWQSGRLEVWILSLGLMRYAFLAAAIRLPFLRADLYPSMRRKTVCVVQVGALCIMLCPWLSPKQAAAVGVAALVCLCYSFATDVLWLFGRRHTGLQSQQK